MTPRIRPFHDPRARQEALDLLAQGELIVLPTDTVYGVAACLKCGAARLMHRFRPQARLPWPMLPLLLASPDLVPQVARTHAVARRLMRRFWPGVLTLLLPPSMQLSPWGRRIAVRVPDLAPLRDFLREAGGWLVVWRAAYPGEPDALDAEDAARSLGEAVALILDSGPARHGVRSTVVDATLPPPRLVQRGALPPEPIRAVVPEIVSSQ